MKELKPVLSQAVRIADCENAEEARKVFKPNRWLMVIDMLLALGYCLEELEPAKQTDGTWIFSMLLWKRKDFDLNTKREIAVLQRLAKNNPKAAEKKLAKMLRELTDGL